LIIVGSFFSDYFLDFATLLVFICYFFPNKFFQISRSTLLASILIGNFFFVFHRHQVFTKKDLTNLSSPTNLTLERDQIANSEMWSINTARVLGINSIFAYTHPLPRFKKLYGEMFHIQSAEELYFFEPPKHDPLLFNFLSIYRYRNLPLTYAPETIMTSEKDFLTKIKSPLSENLTPFTFPFALIEKPAFVESHLPNCKLNLKISNEVVNLDQFEFNFLNNSLHTCLVIIPFNFSSFLYAQINNNPAEIYPANIAQMSLSLPPGNGSVVIAPNNKLYWKIKFVGIALGIILMMFFIFNQRIRFKSFKC
jgi:hypothetical protein